MPSWNMNWLKECLSSSNHQRPAAESVIADVAFGADVLSALSGHFFLPGIQIRQSLLSHKNSPLASLKVPLDSLLFTLN